MSNENEIDNQIASDAPLAAEGPTPFGSEADARETSAANAGHTSATEMATPPEGQEANGPALQATQSFEPTHAYVVEDLGPTPELALHPAGRLLTVLCEVAADGMAGKRVLLSNSSYHTQVDRAAAALSGLTALFQDAHLLSELLDPLIHKGHQTTPTTTDQATLETLIAQAFNSSRRLKAYRLTKRQRGRFFRLFLGAMGTLGAGELNEALTTFRLSHLVPPPETLLGVAMKGLATKLAERIASVVKEAKPENAGPSRIGRDDIVKAMKSMMVAVIEGFTEEVLAELTPMADFLDTVVFLMMADAPPGLERAPFIEWMSCLNVHLAFWRKEIASTFNTAEYRDAAGRAALLAAASKLRAALEQSGLVTYQPIERVMGRFVVYRARSENANRGHVITIIRPTTVIDTGVPAAKAQAVTFSATPPVEPSAPQEATGTKEEEQFDLGELQFRQRDPSAVGGGTYISLMRRMAGELDPIADMGFRFGAAFLATDWLEQLKTLQPAWLTYNACSDDDALTFAAATSTLIVQIAVKHNGTRKTESGRRVIAEPSTVGKLGQAWANFQTDYAYHTRFGAIATLTGSARASVALDGVEPWRRVLIGVDIRWIAKRVNNNGRLIGHEQSAITAFVGPDPYPVAFTWQEILNDPDLRGGMFADVEGMTFPAIDLTQKVSVELAYVDTPADASKPPQIKKKAVNESLAELVAMPIHQSAWRSQPGGREEAVRVAGAMAALWGSISAQVTSPPRSLKKVTADTATSVTAKSLETWVRSAVNTSMEALKLAYQTQLEPVAKAFFGAGRVRQLILELANGHNVPSNTEDQLGVEAFVLNVGAFLKLSFPLGAAGLVDAGKEVPKYIITALERAVDRFTQDSVRPAFALALLTNRAHRSR